ncbi:hypothetical protein KBC54_04355 [Patescibacteria group bacterium]|nr:hypothetical protein [Patescibacteria group bacterium]
MSSFFKKIIAPTVVLVAVYGMIQVRVGVDSSQRAPEGSASSTVSTDIAPPTVSSTVVAHVPLPEEVRGFYWTGYTAGSSRVTSLLAYASSSHLNTVVIDAKMDGGELSFKPYDAALHDAAPKYPAIKDLDGLLLRLKAQGMYRIARVVVMQDGLFGSLHPKTLLRYANGGVWRDNRRMIWVDPAALEVAEYAVLLATELYARGFDEIQFDYVRFPSDGRLSLIKYPVYDGKLSKSDVMKAFFENTGGVLKKKGIPVSFDVFGLTYWNDEGLGIGQRFSDVYPNADAVSPMVYPSHYYRGFEGFVNPALYPYEVIKRTMDKGIQTLQIQDPAIDPVIARKKSRPWIQDFNMGATYDAAKIMAQIKAVRDTGGSGWMLWNARNVYTPTVYGVEK